jgi:hypothetical protein
MKKLNLFLGACLLPLIVCSCSYSSSGGWSFSDSDSVKEEKARRRAVDRKTDRILEVGRTKDRAEARRQAKGEVFEEEFFRPTRP